MNNTSTIPGVPREEVAKFDESTVILALSDRTKKPTTDMDKLRVTLYDELADKGAEMDEATRNKFVQYY